jgi:hypothetical protein
MYPSAGSADCRSFSSSRHQFVAATMNDETLDPVFNKARMFRELHRARIRVRQLERQLRGETAEVEQEPEIPAS